MSLVGFDHVFNEAKTIQVNDSLTVNVPPFRCWRS